MAKYPLLYDPRDPYKHYEKAAKLYKKARRSLYYAIGLPIAAFLLGTVCVMYNSQYMAVHLLFSLAAVLLSIFGSRTYTPVLCLFGALTAAVSAVIAYMTGSFLAPFAAALHVLSFASLIAAAPEINELIKLKELPGFPHFDPALNNLSFSALDSLDAHELLNKKDPEDIKSEEKLAKRSVIKETDDGFPEKEKKALPEKEEDEAPAEEKAAPVHDGSSLGEGYSGNNEKFDKMLQAQSEEKNSEFSDLDLF